MFKKSFLVIILLLFGMITSAYALSETESGPQHVTVCFATGTDAMTSGNVVILQTTSPTYWGREVTGTTTAGLPIYGVVVDTNSYTNAEMASGKWIRVQTIGYTPIIKVAGAGAVTADSAVLVTSTEVFRATSCTEVNTVAPGGNAETVTGNSIALETQKGTRGENYTFKGLLK